MENVKGKKWGDERMANGRRKWRMEGRKRKGCQGKGSYYQ